MAFNNRVVDRDRGWKKFLEKLEKDHELTLGIHRDKGSQTYENGASVAEVAKWMEFGTEDVPARSFLRDWADQNKKDIHAKLTEVSTDVVKKQRKNNSAQALDEFGSWAVGSIKERIRQGINPPLKSSTIAQKQTKNPTPLIDTETLIEAISHKVERL